MIRRVLFDWSGTLCDDAAITRAVTNEVLLHYGARPVGEATYARDFALPIENFYAPRIGPVPRREIDRLFFERFRDRADASQLFAGVRGLLELLDLRGYELGILSTMDQTILDRQLERFGIAGHFASVIGNAADKVPVLQATVAAGRWHPDQCLYIGDTLHDLAAARAAGTVAGAALYGYTPAATLLEVQPDRHYANVAAILDDLDRAAVLAQEQRVLPTVGGLVINSAGEVLLVRTKKWSGLYGLPGGKIQYGETMTAAYYRELREETGLDLDNARWLMVQDCIEHPQFREPRHFLLINYVSHVEGRPSLSANYESHEIGWFEPAQALRMGLNGPTREALEEARHLGFI